jgi:hypothetical protein
LNDFPRHQEWILSFRKVKTAMPAEAQIPVITVLCITNDKNDFYISTEIRHNCRALTFKYTYILKPVSVSFFVGVMIK